MTVPDQTPELTWGSLVLHSQVPPDVPWACVALADSANLGNAVPLVEEIRSMLTDGSLAVVSGWDNREVTFRVRLAAVDGQALAQAEAAFMAEVMADRLAPLIWTPPMVEAWPAVLDVVHVRFDRDYSDQWDYHERYQQQRFYTLTLTCLPWARDPETVVIPAIPVPEEPDAPADYTALNTADTDTNWQGRTSPPSSWSSLVKSASGGKVRYSGTLNWATGGTSPRLGLVFNWGLLDVMPTSATQPYLYVDYDLDPATKNADGGAWVRWNWNMPSGNTGAVAGAVARVRLDNGLMRAYFDVPAYAVHSVLFEYQPVRPGMASNLWGHYIDVYEFGLVDRLEIPGSSGYQIARTAWVGGSAPTQAALRFDASAADPLVGSTALIYTGQRPVVPLRPLVSASASVTVGDYVSGATNNLSTPMEFLVPVDRLCNCTYSLLARLNWTPPNPKVIQWQARIVAADGSEIPGSEVVVSGETLLKNTTTDPWKIHHVADIQLPVVALEGGVDHAVEITLSEPFGTVSFATIDEGWLCDTENGAVTVIHEPSATFQLATVELRSPEIDSPRPAVVGTWVDHGAQDITRLVTAFGTHLFKPGQLHVFTATDLGKYATCELEYYRRYHTHPGPDFLPEDFT